MKNNYSKSVKITAPEGYEINRINSTSDEIIFRKVKLKPYPIDVRDIPFRHHYINRIGSIEYNNDNYIPQLTTDSRARAFLALM